MMFKVKLALVAFVTVLGISASAAEFQYRGNLNGEEVTLTEEQLRETLLAEARIHTIDRANRLGSVASLPRIDRFYSSLWAVLDLTGGPGLVDVVGAVCFIGISSSHTEGLDLEFGYFHPGVNKPTVEVSDVVSLPGGSFQVFRTKKFDLPNLTANAEHGCHVGNAWLEEANSNQLIDHLSLHLEESRTATQYHQGRFLPPISPMGQLPNDGGSRILAIESRMEPSPKGLGCRVDTWIQDFVPGVDRASVQLLSDSLQFLGDTAEVIPISIKEQDASLRYAVSLGSRRNLTQITTHFEPRGQNYFYDCNEVQVSLEGDRTLRVFGWNFTLFP